MSVFEMSRERFAELLMSGDIVRVVPQDPRPAPQGTYGALWYAGNGFGPDVNAEMVSEAVAYSAARRAAAEVA